MKKILLTLVMSVGLYAGGSIPDIIPVYEYESEPLQVSPFYVGAGFGFDKEVGNYYIYEYSPTLVEYQYTEYYTNVSLFGGAVAVREGQFALALESRLSWSTDDYGIDAWGVFIKPEFDINDNFTLFGLIGYQQLSIPDDITYDATGLGLGGKYMFTDEFGTQVDYVYSYIGEDEFGFEPEYGNFTVSVLYNF